MRLAELFPSRLLVVVKVVQFVEFFGQFDQVGLQPVEAFDELPAFPVAEERVDQRQAVADLFGPRDNRRCRPIA